jgi:hypothetical protein
MGLFKDDDDKKAEENEASTDPNAVTDTPTAVSEGDATEQVDQDAYVGVDPIYQNAASVQNEPFEGEDDDDVVERAKDYEEDVVVQDPASGPSVEERAKPDGDDDDNSNDE